MLHRLVGVDNSTQMQVAGFMSLSGSVLDAIIAYEKHLEQEHGRSPYHVAAIFSDRITSKATEKGAKHNLPVITRSLKGFYEATGADTSDLDARAEFDAETIKALEPYDVDVIACAGYMSILTPKILKKFLCVNVHPADLAIVDAQGKPIYTGDNAVADAIVAGEEYLRSSTHIMIPEVDEGPLLMRSKAIPVVGRENINLKDPKALEAFADEQQGNLKQFGDYVIFPRTLEAIANGRFQTDRDGLMHYDGKPVPQGHVLEF